MDAFGGRQKRQSNGNKRRDPFGMGGGFGGGFFDDEDDFGFGGGFGGMGGGQSMFSQM